MEEIEVPTEHLLEHLHHQAEHSGERWVTGVALSSALLAVFAAVSALLAGHHANEAMTKRIEASDSWSYYQAKGIKASVLSGKLELLTALGKPVADKDREKVSEYKHDQDEISEKAKKLEESSENHLQQHMVFSRAVTLFQVAIGIAAIAALTRRRKYWWVGLAFGTVGLFFLIQGFYQSATAPI
jgi:hypothetical protein